MLTSLLAFYFLGVFICSMIGLAVATTSANMVRDHRIGSRMFFLAPVWPLALMVLVLLKGKDGFLALVGLLRSMWKSAWGK